MNSRTKIKRYERNFKDETGSVALYQALAKMESNAKIAEVFQRIAQQEQRHADIWKHKLETLGWAIPHKPLEFRWRLIIWLAKRFGPAFILPALTEMEYNGSRRYQQDPEARDGELFVQEHSHARVLRAIGKGAEEGIEGSELARMEGRHHAIGGNVLRASVLGANDGLVSNVSLIMGVVGANFSEQTIIITGLAGLLAGAGSMAMGEWISVQSSRELSQRQIDIESDEIDEMPEEEQEEMVLIFEAKGLKKEDAQNLAKELMSDKHRALDTLTREELGIDPEKLGGTAWEAAISSFLLFVFGASIPLIPFAIFDKQLAIFSGILFSALMLFVFGAAVALITGRSIFYSGFRQLLLGLAAATITYGTGRFLGITVLN
ncbi:VIT1/CCC1 transporter family protein [Candidatus Nitronereus thalassa]|uniref:VIT1/CCC1 transporter family protein n=1 Tax=Candidatus Nitronereus thalassa TaxID=3020898 RepID=A0ABU3KBF5_9BACT|nr:VIT1/CCC1 transporter family protein [Candidatus Nitronereus thalassa]MDT7043759.1 VIT1/CCC1 transporter family protein [Candidatus Nitronereus thalassa]